MSDPKLDNVLRGKDEEWCSDVESIGKIADCKEERRQALDACLLRWGNRGIGLLERVDSGGDHGWQMWLWKPA